jgi:hypothetical protein
MDGLNQCNTDVGFGSDLNKTSADWIVRDYTGQFFMAGTT